MSCCYRKETVTAPVIVPRPVNNNCICSFPALIMLILIVLVFSKRCCNVGEDDEGGYAGGIGQQVGNGVLFIIAFYFLACAGCGAGSYGAGYGGGYGAY